MVRHMREHVKLTYARDVRLTLTVTAVALLGASTAALLVGAVLWTH